jgi:hypothetical protein
VLDRIKEDQQFCFLRCANTQSFVSAEVGHACVELIRLVVNIYPLLVQFDEGFDAFEKLVFIEDRHIQMVTGLFKELHVILNAEALKFTGLFVLTNTCTLMH